MKPPIWFAAAIGSIGCAQSCAAQSNPTCDKTWAVPKAERLRALTAEDLVRVRDIGVHDLGWPGAKPVAISPDRQQIAFQLRRADPEANKYCLQMVVMPLRPGAKPLIVDIGDDMLRYRFDFRGRADVATGNPLSIDPLWLPGGKRLAFLKRSGPHIQIWIASIDGTGSVPVTSSTSDIEAFQLSRDGRSVIYATRPGLLLARQDAEREGLSGFHFDKRFSSISSDVPAPSDRIIREYHRYDFASGAIRLASKVEANQLSSGRDVPIEGNNAEVVEEADQLIPRGRVQFRSGKVVIQCGRARCSGDVSRPWLAGPTRVRFLRREGWARSVTAIYEWNIKSGRVKQLYTTDDVLAYCQPTAEGLLCLRESSVTPRQVTLLNLDDRRQRIVFDPNPEFAHLSMGAVERIRWKNASGIETYGDLVLPRNHKRGVRYPLVVVQYESRGFLRGGTGDEYPIQAFANRGYAVLSFNRPRDIGLDSRPATWVENERANLSGFADRRSVLSSLEKGISLIEGRGLIDGQRIGLTGLSDGATTVQFALIHSQLFAAAAISSDPWDQSFAMLVDPQTLSDFKTVGYPGLVNANAAFWLEFSLARNASPALPPVLMQLADDEFRGALETYTALREADAAVEMFVFPGEHHIKWQPAHRLAIYRRNLDWFDYWLRGDRSSDPDRQQDLAAWDALRLKREAALAAQTAAPRPSQ